MSEIWLNLFSKLEEGLLKCLTLQKVMVNRKGTRMTVCFDAARLLDDQEFHKIKAALQEGFPGIALKLMVAYPDLAQRFTGDINGFVPFIDKILCQESPGARPFLRDAQWEMKDKRVILSIGSAAGKKTAALITNMDIPLGNYIGNALEVAEAVEVLKGGGPSDLREVCLHLAANMLELADKGDFAECMETAQKTLEDGSAFSKFLEMAEAQGGDISCIRDTSRLPFAPLRYEVRARKEGYIAHMDTQACGTASVLLGAGRETKESLLDYGAGIILKKKTGDYVKEGDVLAEFLASEEKLFPAAEEKFHSALTIAAERPEKEKLILGKVSANCTEIF